MIILTMLWFILLLLAVAFVIFIVAQYNTLIHLRMTCQQTLQDIVTTILEKASWVKSLTELLSTLHKTTSLEKQVSIINKLHDFIIESKGTSAEMKTLHTLESHLQTEKRFYTNTARELNDRLTTFPGQQIWSLFDVHTVPLVTLNDDAREGIMPEAKYI